jgi:hypothetical protein
MAFERRAKARHGEPIEYDYPVFTNEHVLRIDGKKSVEINLITAGGAMLRLLFEPGVDVEK